jgi:transposase
LPKLNGKYFSWFVSEIGRHLEHKSLFIANGVTAHKAKFFDSERLIFERLPAACPELNPVERFFKEVGRRLKTVFLKHLSKLRLVLKRW